MGGLVWALNPAVLFCGKRTPELPLERPRTDLRGPYFQVCRERLLRIPCSHFLISVSNNQGSLLRNVGVLHKGFRFCGHAHGSKCLEDQPSPQHLNMIAGGLGPKP